MWAAHKAFHVISTFGSTAMLQNLGTTWTVPSTTQGYVWAGNFHADLRFHPTDVEWNLRLTWKNPLGMLVNTEAAAYQHPTPSPFVSFTMSTLKRISEGVSLCSLGGGNSLNTIVTLIAHDYCDCLCRYSLHLSSKFWQFFNIMLHFLIESLDLWICIGTCPAYSKFI